MRNSNNTEKHYQDNQLYQSIDHAAVCGELVQSASWLDARHGSVEVLTYNKVYIGGELRVIRQT